MLWEKSRKHITQRSFTPRHFIFSEMLRCLLRMRVISIRRLCCIWTGMSHWVIEAVERSGGHFFGIHHKKHNKQFKKILWYCDSFPGIWGFHSVTYLRWRCFSIGTGYQVWWKNSASCYEENLAAAFMWSIWVFPKIVVKPPKWMVYNGSKPY